MKSMQENCGVFGLYSKKECVYDIFHGIDFLQHRGQEYCGISTFDPNIDQATQVDFFKLGNKNMRMTHPSVRK
jgi:amidophosphoribosyltransferase